MAVTANKTRHGSAQGALIRLTPVAAVLAMGLSAPVQAVDWRLTPTVGAAATYSDNVRQSPTSPEDAMILSVTPGFSLRSVGSRRVQASLQYGLRATSRFGDNESNDLDHNLNATGKAEIIEDFLFIDGSARVSQELISLLGSPAESEINSSNRATVSSYSLSPYIKKRFGTFADLQARYTASGAIFENDVAAQSSVNSFNVDLDSGTRFNDVAWGLAYSIRKAQNSKAADSTFERAKAYAGVQVTPKFRLIGAVGQDWNDYLSATETSGASYSVGFGWAPSRRTNLSASVGERFFGNTYNVTGTHRTRRTNWTVRYYEDVSDVSQDLYTVNSRLFWVCEGGLAEGPNPPVGLGDCLPPVSAMQLLTEASEYLNPEQLLAWGVDNNLLDKSLASGVYIIKSLNAGVSWSLGKLGLGLAARDTKRIYQLPFNPEDHVQGVTGSVNYRLSRNTIAQSSLSLTRNTVTTPGTISREDDIFSLGLGLSYRFAKDVSGGLFYQYTQRDSNVAIADYEENRLTATVKMSF